MIEKIWAGITMWWAKQTDAKQFRQTLINSAVVAAAFIVLYGIGTFLPEGFDWKVYYKVGRYHPIWTPWTRYIIMALNYPAIFALTVLGIALRAYRYKRSALPLLLAMLSLPTLWVFFMGNLDGLVLVGFLLMPLGVPLVTMKPQVAAFALLAKKNWFVAGAVWGILSLLIWGFWPQNLLMVVQPEWRMEWTQDISLFPWGILLGAPLLWLSRGDEDLLMAAGSLLTPHLFPYHFILLVPAMARMNGLWMVLTWAVSWTPLLSNYLGDWAWHFGNLMSIFFWLGIVLNSPELRQRIRGDFQRLLRRK
jgi:hypothetical protein